MKNIWNHHLVKLFLWIWINPTDESSKLYGNLVHGKHFLKLSMHHRSRVPEPIGGSTKVATGSDGTECQFATSMERTNSNSVKAAILEITSVTPHFIYSKSASNHWQWLFLFEALSYLFHRWTWLKRHLDHSKLRTEKFSSGFGPLARTILSTSHDVCSCQKQVVLRSVWQPICSQQIDLWSVGRALFFIIS